MWHAVAMDLLVRGLRCLVAVCLAGLSVDAAVAQTRIMPLGDSITQGVLDHCGYRYALWFDLDQAGAVVDFVGSNDVVSGTDPPNPIWYPDYFTTFDRDHESYSGYRTDQILEIVGAAVGDARPDIVLIHLGTNDVGQNGAAGVTAADTNLRSMIAEIRIDVPNAVILLAQIPPIGTGNAYTPNAGQVAPLNSAIALVAADLDTLQSPVEIVDMNTGFDLGTMMQADNLHPNTTGEAELASRWDTALASHLSSGNAPPRVSITAPQSGELFVGGASQLLSADASDVDGSVVEVRFFVDDVPAGSDTTPPYQVVWPTPFIGTHTITAEVEDDEAAISTADPVHVTVVPFGVNDSISISNASFETPSLSDGITSDGPGSFSGWVLSGSTNTFVGILNPPAGSYPEAVGNAPALGAEGANVAYLFNDGGPAESVEAAQVLSDTLAASSFYILEVAIGRFLPTQPYSASNYGGYRVELLAGSTVIASDEDSITPPSAEFQDAIAIVSTDDLPKALIGQTLSIRLTISSTEEDRSTHFDDVRLTKGIVALPAFSPPGLLGLCVALAASTPLAERVAARRRRRGAVSDSV